MFKDIKAIVDDLVVLMKDNNLRSVEYSRHADAGEQKDGLEDEVLTIDGITEAVLKGGMITSIPPNIDKEISSELICISDYLLPEKDVLKSYSVRAKVKKGFVTFTAELGIGDVVNTLKVQFK